MRLQFFSGNPTKNPVLNFIINPLILAGSSSFRFLPKPLRVDSSIRRSFSISMAVPPPKPAGIQAVLSSDEGLAKRLWMKFRGESILAMYTPFAVCLAAGNLKIESFRQYINQDIYFLKAFAQAYELAEECSDDDDAKVAISELRKSVLEEMKMHASFMKEWGSDLANDAAINLATVKYTDFLLATASGKIEGVKDPIKLATPFERTKLAAYTLGAMTPCMRLYAFLGTEFQALLDSDGSSHLYRAWIDNYSSENFQAAALQTEDLLDKLSVPLTGEELGVIEKLYHQAMKLEREFFTSQLLFQPTVVPLRKEHDPAKDCLMIFSDFDLTCTVIDSCAVLAEIAKVTASKSSSQAENQITLMSSTDLRNTWDLLSKQYTEEYEQCIERIMPIEKAKKFNYEILHKALEQLSEFERRANSRVIESGVLRGLCLEDIKRAGGRLILQDGCSSFFQQIIKNENLNANVHVLSYCWCGDLIRSAFTSGGLNSLSVHANEFNFRESISTGEIIRKVESPIDKVEVFNSILKECSNDWKKLTIYIGDSVGDLLCLLEADIGIVIGSSSSLRRVGSQFGVSFVPLHPGLVKKQKEYVEGSSNNWKGLSGTLYTASSWTEIHAFILGC